MVARVQLKCLAIWVWLASIGLMPTALSLCGTVKGGISYVLFYYPLCFGNVPLHFTQLSVKVFSDLFYCCTCVFKTVVWILSFSRQVMMYYLNATWKWFDATPRSTTIQDDKVTQDCKTTKAKKCLKTIKHFKLVRHSNWFQEVIRLSLQDPSRRRHLWLKDAPEVRDSQMVSRRKHLPLQDAPNRPSKPVQGGPRWWH